MHCPLLHVATDTVTVSCVVTCTGKPHKISCSELHAPRLQQHSYYEFLEQHDSSRSQGTILAQRKSATKAILF